MKHLELKEVELFLMLDKVKHQKDLYNALVKFFEGAKNVK